MKAGDRVTGDGIDCTGTIEEIRPSSPSSDGDYLVAVILWDTGARCAEPLSWLTPLEARVQARKIRRDAVKEIRKLHAEQEQRKLPERECDGCSRWFRPTRQGQRFHAESCRKKSRYLGLV